MLLAVGGVLYTLGAIVYGFKWPNPWPSWFGFHEVFHAFTIAAFIVHYIGVWLLAYQTRTDPRLSPRSESPGPSMRVGRPGRWQTKPWQT